MHVRLLLALLVVLCASTLSAQEQFRLPAWMAAAIGKEQAAQAEREGSRAAPATRLSVVPYRFEFFGAYAYRHEKLNDTTGQVEAVSTIDGWQDSTRAVVTFDSPGNEHTRLTYLVDLDADVAVMAVRQGAQNNLGIDHISTLVRPLFAERDIWDQYARDPLDSTTGRTTTLLGRACEERVVRSGREVFPETYWTDPKLAPAFLGLHRWMRVVCGEPFARIVPLALQRHGYPLKWEAPYARLTATALKPGKQPMPKLDLRSYRLSGVFEVEQQLRGVQADEMYGGGASPAGITDPNAPLPLNRVQQHPEFPGGVAVRDEFLRKNTLYPEMEREAGISGKVYVQFVIGRWGGVGEAKVLSGLSPGLDKEALRVVRSMPPWVPGRKDGRAVPVVLTLPIVFKLP